MLIPLEDYLYRLDTPFLGVAFSLYVITCDQMVGGQKHYLRAE